MAVAIVGTVGVFDTPAPGTSRTANYTLHASANLLFVMVHWTNAGVSISSVTWGGVAMTSVGAAVSDAGDHHTQMFYKTGPTTGNADIVVSFTGGSADFAVIGAYGLSGVDQTTPTSDYQTNTGNSAPSPADGPAVTSEVGDMVMNAFTRDGDNVLTAINQTEDYTGFDDSFLVGAGGHADGAASVDPGWSWGAGNATWGMASVNVNASAAADRRFLLVR